MSTGVELRYLIICEEGQMINAGNDSKTVIVQPIINHKVPFVPTQITFSVMAGLTMPDDKHSVNLTFELFSPDNEMIYKNIETVSIPTTPKLQYPIIALGFGLKNVIVRSEGEYTMAMECDGVKIGEQKIRVMKQES
ncbi:hypothetical protein HUB98_08960 [Paenibacillus barcinonensis]|uniref:Uncharacterized protein n=1 Tax=Paenibacillus barcinonensis TaxID=198119 RepID=A0A2V4V5I8_PAEBA|nr:hypothetical protein [Paenibacillus barcinonensis]PYE47553.1 hypothetical protein DFQ00_113147 [Paenibacillus barcinonensis]QKS56457.1 hypothetical protein HUB98_08960 [Paenibacillus barcinonensis]